jgi:DNA invertase Pin-like site-specific DNA recombinase
MSSPNGKAPLRFASLIRVSTDRQEKQGESLAAQRSANLRDVGQLGGTVVGCYGGQEHATAGWERREVDRLIKDAGKDLFDAVIVAYADRWSRDNAKSEEGLGAFRTNGIRFFMGAMELDLFDPQHRFMLGMSVVAGEFFALQQAKKSIESRIERARRGVPTASRLPYARVFDKATGAWRLDPDKLAVITDIIDRFLRGASLLALAKEYGLDHSGLCRVLKHQLGDAWEMVFASDKLNIHETVPFTIPPLVDEATAKRVRQRMEANRTYFHEPPRPVHEYLLSGFVFCDACGYSLIGEAIKKELKRGPGAGKTYVNRYYRHPHKDRTRPCPLKPRPWVPAGRLEGHVISQLVKLVGNPAAIRRAVAAATPDDGAARGRLGRLREERSRVERARERIVALVAADALTTAQAAKQLNELKDREAHLIQEAAGIEATLEGVPSAADVEVFVQQVGQSILVFKDHYGPDGSWVGQDVSAANDLGALLDIARRPADQRALLEACFGQPLPDGRPAGIYVSPAGGPVAHRPKAWGYVMKGRLEFEAIYQLGVNPGLPWKGPVLEIGRGQTG